MTEEIDEKLLEDLYAWVDTIPLSRPKKDIRRDFADGVLIAEVVHSHCPQLVELHNYCPANNVKNKTTNWKLLNRKVFQKLNFEVKDDIIEAIVTCKPYAVENFLLLLRRKIDRYLFEAKRKKEKEMQNQKLSSQPKFKSMPQLSDRPEADQAYKNIWNDGSSAFSDSGSAGRMSNGSIATKRGAPGRIAQKGPPSQHSGPPRVMSHPQSRMRDLSAFPGEMVPKVAVEELEQEILARDETVQILEAKIRRLEQLLHLKDIRLDDLQTRLDRLEGEKKPTAQLPAHGHMHHAKSHGHMQ